MHSERIVPQIQSVYDPSEEKRRFEQSQQREADKRAKEGKTKKRVVDMNKSYESMGSQEAEKPHYNYDSDGEPPVDQPGDKLSVIKR